MASWGDRASGEIYLLHGPFRVVDLTSAEGERLWKSLGSNPATTLKAGYDGIQHHHYEDIKICAFYKDISLEEVRGAHEIQLFRDTAIQRYGLL